MRAIDSASVPLIYIDPPFNTGRRQTRPQMKTVRDEAGDRTGFGGRRYRTELVPQTSAPAGYSDAFDDFLGFLRPRLAEAHRILSPSGSLFFHIDPREVHYCKVLLDQIFTRPCFQNEIIWAYDYGARATKRWPAKHDNILWYTRDPALYTFNLSATDRIPYMAPKLVGEAKAARGKTPHRRLVAHHRLAHRQREDWVCNAKALRDFGAHRSRPLQPRRPRPRFLCWQRDDR